MKILVVSNFYPPHYVGGYELGCKQVVDLLRERGHEIEVLTGTYGVQFPTLEGHIHRKLDIRLDWPDIRKEPLSYIRRELINKRAFQRLHNSFQPDLIYFWNIQLGCQSLTLYADRSGLPVVYYASDHWVERFKDIDTLYSLLNNKAKTLRGKLLRKLIRCLLLALRCIPPEGLPRPNLVQFCSNYMLRNAGNFTALQKTVVHWGIDLPERDLAEYRWPPKKLLFAGQLIPAKGIRTAIEAFGRLIKDPRFPELTLTVAGTCLDPVFDAELKRIAVESGARDRIIFCGKLERSSVANLLSSHDVFVFASEWEEPFSIGLLEAMACGLAVVGTQTGGTPEILEPGKTGIAFDAGNVSSCANAIAMVLSDESMYASVRANAYSLVRSKFTISSMVDKLEMQLVNVINDRTSQTPQSHSAP